MMPGNPNWWSKMYGVHPQLSPSNSQFVYGSSNSSLPSNPTPPDQEFQIRSWSQLLLSGLGNGGEEERYSAGLFQQQKKLDNWEDQVLNLNPSFTTRISNPVVDVVKQEVSQSTRCQIYGHQLDQLQNEFHHHNISTTSNSWALHNQVIPVSSPTSCVTTLSNNFLNFSTATVKVKSNHERHEDNISEGNSRSTGGVSNKKARVQQSSAQPALKVRKEKLGDRITALHQLVSPFGKTDTASVLSEAIGYIRFLQGQIEALSTPYMRNASESTGSHQHSVQERNCLFSEEPSQDSQGRGLEDLRSRGLCLVPITCTQQVGNDNSADYWAPAAFGGGF